MWQSEAMIPTRIDDIDWSTWKAEMRATEVLVVRDGQILLIRKKRGLGAGKINGPGGRLEPDESVEACGVREVQEELCVTPTGVVWMADHRVQFVDGLTIHLDVFRADDIRGVPTETAEAEPHWFALDQIPYHEMWADTRLWIPWLLADRRCSGRFVFDGDTLLDHALRPTDRTGPSELP